jgi:hypothetical protein
VRLSAQLRGKLNLWDEQTLEICWQFWRPFFAKTSSCCSRPATNEPTLSLRAIGPRVALCILIIQLSLKGRGRTRGTWGKAGDVLLVLLHLQAKADTIHVARRDKFCCKIVYKTKHQWHLTLKFMNQQCQSSQTLIPICLPLQTMWPKIRDCGPPGLPDFAWWRMVSAICLGGKGAVVLHVAAQPHHLRPCLAQPCGRMTSAVAIGMC